MRPVSARRVPVPKRRSRASPRRRCRPPQESSPASGGRTRKCDDLVSVEPDDVEASACFRVVRGLLLVGVHANDNVRLPVWSMSANTGTEDHVPHVPQPARLVDAVRPAGAAGYSRAWRPQSHVVRAVVDVADARARRLLADAVVGDVVRPAPRAAFRRVTVRHETPPGFDGVKSALAGRRRSREYCVSVRSPTAARGDLPRAGTTGRPLSAVVLHDIEPELEDPKAIKL